MSNYRWNQRKSQTGILQLSIARSSGKIIILSTIATVDHAFFHNIPEYICVKSIVENISQCSFYKTRDDRQYFVAQPPRIFTEMNNTPTGRAGAERPEHMAKKLIQTVEGQEPGRLLRFLAFGEESED